MKPPERAPALGRDDEERVRQFLSTHPDFFARNPELVERLIVPHECGPAQSLIEHQVALLRVRNRKLERRLAELIKTARDNESLHGRVHGLGLRLLECRDTDTLFDVLYHGLSRDYRVDAVMVRVRVNESQAARLSRPEFVAEPAAAAACPALAVRSAVCGVLSEEVRVGLFGWPVESAGSGVLIPLSAGGHQGVLALASRDAKRFHAQMGTTFLEQLSSLLSHALGHLLAEQH